MDYDKELLTVMMEECAEVIVECSKLIRFGMDASYEGVSTVENLEKELGDLQCMIDLLHKRDYISYTKMDEYAEAKYKKLKKWSNLIQE